MKKIRDITIKMRDDFNNGNGIVICDDIVIAKIRIRKTIPDETIIIGKEKHKDYFYCAEWFVQEDDEHFNFVPKENKARFKTIDDIQKFFEIADINMLRYNYNNAISL